MDAVAPDPLADQALQHTRERLLSRLTQLLNEHTRGRQLLDCVHQLADREFQLLHTTLAQEGAETPDATASCAARCRAAASQSLALRSAMLHLAQLQRTHRSRGIAELRSLVPEIHELVLDLGRTLISNAVLERQREAMERIVTGRGWGGDWNDYARNLLLEIHPFVPFHCAAIVTRAADGVELHLFRPPDGDVPADPAARERLQAQMMQSCAVAQGVPARIRSHTLPGLRSPGPLAAGGRILGLPVGLAEAEPGGVCGVAALFACSPTPVEGEMLRSLLAVLGMAMDSARRVSRTLDELTYHASHDTLTGLLNRRCFREAVEREQARAGRTQGQFALLSMDLDCFKRINDNLGHLTGDQVLREVGRTLAQGVRRSDVCARIGGDEFQILLPDTDAASARKVAEGLRRRLRALRFPFAAGKLRVSVSIGVCSFPADGGDVGTLMARLDSALYRAKAGGRDRVTSAAQDLPRPCVGGGGAHHPLIASDIRDALREKRVLPHFQPIRRLARSHQGQLLGHEVLARLSDRGSRLIPAARFITVVEEQGLERDLDAAILARALPLLAGEEPDATRLFVNLSPREVLAGTLTRYARVLCGRLGLLPWRLVFELTERCAVANFPALARAVAASRERGFGFALDDFGTGYGSFQFLQDIPFDYVKLSGSLVRRVTQAPAERAILANSVRLCADLGIPVIAEEVERQDTLECLGDLGVDYVQGYLLGRPGPGFTSGD